VAFSISRFRRLETPSKAAVAAPTCAGIRPVAWSAGTCGVATDREERPSTQGKVNGKTGKGKRDEGGRVCVGREVDLPRQGWDAVRKGARKGQEEEEKEEKRTKTTSASSPSVSHCLIGTLKACRR
jgi:hypothetical protein